MLHRWISTTSAYTTHGSCTVAYLSAEFLMGPHLGNNLVNLGMYDVVRARGNRDRPGFRRAAVLRGRAGSRQRRPRPPRGGFLDSLATLEIPAIGYGIRYEFGIFQQEIIDGWQVEKTGKWLRFSNPWEIAIRN